jgi:hypothetical protein
MPLAIRVSQLSMEQVQGFPDPGKPHLQTALGNVGTTSRPIAAREVAPLFSEEKSPYNFFIG